MNLGKVMSLLKAALFIGLIVLGMWQYKDWNSKQFNLQNIQKDTSLAISVPDNETLPVDIAKILSQNFTFLDRGHQSFVFESQDKKYVLKFFQKKRGESEWSKKKDIRNFIGFKIAYEKDKENSGLLYIHLRPTEELINHTFVSDSVKEKIDLDHVVFALQYKGEPTGKLFSRLLANGEVELVKRHLHSMLDMYLSTYQKGIYDRDHNLMDNTGFIDEKPIRLDVGKLREDKRFKDLNFARKDLEKVFIKRVDKWLKVHFPQYLSEIHQDMQETIYKIFD